MRYHDDGHEDDDDDDDDENDENHLQVLSASHSYVLSQPIKCPLTVNALACSITILSFTWSLHDRITNCWATNRNTHAQVPEHPIDRLPFAILMWLCFTSLPLFLSRCLSLWLFSLYFPEWRRFICVLPVGLFSQFIFGARGFVLIFCLLKPNKPSWLSLMLFVGPFQTFRTHEWQQVFSQR